MRQQGFLLRYMLDVTSCTQIMEAGLSPGDYIWPIKAFIFECMYICMDVPTYVYDSLK
jgi:hypothetical protein